MITGVLNTNTNQDAYIASGNQSGNVHVSSGQYLYLAVQGSWIPVIIRFSPQSGDWFFQNLENINVHGQKVMIKRDFLS